MTIKDIARACHEVNRAYCQSIGDNSQNPWERAPEWQRDSALKGVQFAIAHPDSAPEDQHNAWCADKIAQGWLHGPVKDAAAKMHPCLVPYNYLPSSQRAKDALFLAVARSLIPCLAVKTII